MQTMSDMRAQLQARAAEDEAFRAQLLADPKSAIAAEFGIAIPDNFSIHVHEDSTTAAHIVLPMSDRLAEAELALASAGNGPFAPMQPAPNPPEVAPHSG